MSVHRLKNAMHILPRLLLFIFCCGFLTPFLSAQPPTMEPRGTQPFALISPTPSERSTQFDTLIQRISKHQHLTPTERQRYPLGLHTEAYYERAARYAGEQIEILKTFREEELDFGRQISKSLMLFQLQDDIDRHTYRSFLNPILSDDGFHVDFGFKPNVFSFRTRQDYLDYLRQLRAFPEYCRQHFQLMRQGLREGISQPRVILEGYESTWEQHITDVVENSIFYAPFTRIPEGFGAPLRDSLLTAGRAAVADSVVYGYRAVKDFFEREYLPRCRKQTAAASLPYGRLFYQNRVQYYTTTNLTADSIHRLGLAEVARIKAEMETVMASVAFEGTLQDFIRFLRTDPRFYAQTPEQLLEKAAFYSKKADGILPRFFGRLPRQPYGVAPVPDHLAPKYTGGRYVPASIKSANAGTYWVNTYKLEHRPLYVLEALTLHEAVPGHHLQGALTQELEHLPEFRKNMYINAFGEGWGLYCEHLGTEMGFYNDPYNRFGRLTYEMWRACRLVVDTGLHAFGWSREQAMDYLAAHTALSLHEVRTETDRYIAWPGQALAYKIGELKIKELRAKTEKSLGEKFDIRAFHDALLSEGTLTLPLLEKRIDRFIAAQKNK
jgi:uncharacterized protein (DUF885 family)